MKTLGFFAEWHSAMTLSAWLVLLLCRGRGPFEGSRDVKAYGFAGGWLLWSHPLSADG